MTAVRPTDGLKLAPWLCRRCHCALWWRVFPGTARDPELIDVEGRAHCRPIKRYQYRTHALPRVERRSR